MGYSTKGPALIRALAVVMCSSLLCGCGRDDSADRSAGAKQYDKMIYFAMDIHIRVSADDVHSIRKICPEFIIMTSVDPDYLDNSMNARFQVNWNNGGPDYWFMIDRLDPSGRVQIGEGHHDRFEDAAAHICKTVRGAQ